MTTTTTTATRNEPRPNRRAWRHRPRTWFPPGWGVGAGLYPSPVRARFYPPTFTNQNPYYPICLSLLLALTILRWGNHMKLFGSMLAVACVALLVVPGLPQDRPFSANKVMKGCSAFVAKTKWEREGSQDDAFLSGICIGVVSTLADLEQKATGVCKPEEVTGEQ